MGQHRVSYLVSFALLPEFHVILQVQRRHTRRQLVGGIDP